MHNETMNPHLEEEPRFCLTEEGADTLVDGDRAVVKTGVNLNLVHPSKYAAVEV